MREIVACVGRGEVWGMFREVMVVFAEDVREKGGAVGVRNFRLQDEGAHQWVGQEYWGRLTLLSGWESLCVQIELMLFAVLFDVSFQIPLLYEDSPPPPEPVLLIDSPPASDVLPGTGDGADDPFDAPTFLICARTCKS